jgi:hypothetical protein
VAGHGGYQYLSDGQRIISGHGNGTVRSVGSWAETAELSLISLELTLITLLTLSPEPHCRCMLELIGVVEGSSVASCISRACLMLQF